MQARRSAPDPSGEAIPDVGIPDLVPVLSSGKHRRPSDGGCFMEFASYLAGERWSDHPDCTHPLLASLARLVNDAMTDHGRARLAPLVPAVVGLTSTQLRVDAVIARRCAITALPVAPPDQQRALAVAVLVAERLLAHLDGRSPDDLGDEAVAALARAPEAAAWATRFADRRVPKAKAYRRVAARAAVRCSVKGILAARPADPDAALHDLLARVIDDCLVATGRPVAPLDAERWSEGCALLEDQRLST